MGQMEIKRATEIERFIDLLNRCRPEYSWLSFDIAADIEELCRNSIFEESDVLDFYNFLNLRPSGNYIPLEGNIRRACFLIRSLSKYICIDNKEKVLEKLPKRKEQLTDKDIVVYWQTEIAKKCGISYSELCKRSTECGQDKVAGRSQSSKNKQFVIELDEILQKYEQTNDIRA